jgi:hypothetical protein
MDYQFFFELEIEKSVIATLACRNAYPGKSFLDR